MPSCIVACNGSCPSLLPWTSSALTYALLFYRENDITDVIDETFTKTEDRFGEMVQVDLKPGGADIVVTEENKKDYVEYVFFSHASR